MPVHFVRYEQRNGFIDNWLVAGPQAIPVPDLERYPGDDWKLQIARHFYEPDLALPQLPVQDELLRLGDIELPWAYVRCKDDHYVDRSGFYHTVHYLRAWAFGRVVCPAAQHATCVITTNGPADVWLNGKHVLRHEQFYLQLPHSVAFEADLVAGANDCLVRFEGVAARACPNVMALQIQELSPEAFVFVPTSYEAVARRATVETAIEAAYLERDVYVWDDEIALQWDKRMGVSSNLTVRLQQPEGWIHSEARPAVSPGERITLAQPFQVPEGPFHVLLLPPLELYYDGNLRLERTVALTAVKNRYSQERYGQYLERRQEALLDAARREKGIFSEIAKMALGYWADVKNDVFLEAIAGINARKDCSDFFLVGLLGMLIRYGQDASFPDALKQPLAECILNFKYWTDEPGVDAMCTWTENHQILFHACEVLAGQLYPERIFTNAGQTGAWHRAKGERLALGWLQQKGAGGFIEWDSNCYFEEDILALSHLVDLAEAPAVYDLATVIMDKMFLTMALNSYKGTFGSTHGRAYVEHIKGGRGESTAGVSRLMWGLGVFNSKILATVGLACMNDYGFPLMIGDIAADLPDEMWNREHHAGSFEWVRDHNSGDWEVNKVTYKTPDYMLCSAQDYRPGQTGIQQHIWQATLGPDAVVFVSHPPCVSESNDHRPGFWHGNVILPRAAQWKDVLISVHNLPADDWLGFTHAYFPAWAFDAYEIRKDPAGRDWMFARKGDGYLALSASCGLEFITRGDSAYRELRSHGLHNVWVCQMGRAALDGDFETFQAKVLALEVEFDDLAVKLRTLRGDTLAFGWEGPLLRNGAVEPITGFRHYDNPYCVADFPATAMDVRYGDLTMRLDFQPDAEHG